MSNHCCFFAENSKIKSNTGTLVLTFQITIPIEEPMN